MYVAVALLMISALSSSSMLALWAATARRHWFVRVGVIILGLSPFLMVSAFDVFWALSLQATIVSGTLCGIRFRKDEMDTRTSRFALSDMFFVTAVASIAVPIAVKTWSVQLATGWRGTAAFGILGAALSLLSYWATASRRPVVSRVAACSVCCILLSVGLPRLPTLIQDGIWGESPSWWFWLAVCGATVLVGTLFMASMRSSHRAKLPLCAAVVIIAASPTAYFWLQLIQGTPRPSIAKPTPNGYDDLVAAGQLTDCIAFSDWSVTPLPQLKAEVKKRDAAFQQASLGLQRECAVPIGFRFADLETDHLTALRALARAFMARAQVSIADGKLDAALDDYESTLKLSCRCRNGGLRVHWLVGAAIESTGLQSIYRERKRLDVEQALRMIGAVEHIDAMLEPRSAMEVRERAWTERASGWPGHLAMLIEGNEMSLSNFFDIHQGTRATHRRLLTTALAIQVFEHRNGHLPHDLMELIPYELESVPTDPFDPEGRPLRYRLEGDLYVLYSVHKNGVDDGGEGTEEGGGSLGLDLRADILFGF